MIPTNARICHAGHSELELHRPIAPFDIAHCKGTIAGQWKYGDRLVARRRSIEEIDKAAFPTSVLITQHG